MKSKRTLSAREMVDDIHRGLTDQGLMNKYRLSALGLQSAFRKLVAAKYIVHDDVKGRMPSFADTLDLSQSRRMPRHYPVVRLPIFDLEDLNMETYAIRDLSEKGVQISGMSLEIGSVKTFLVQLEKFADLLPFHFEAQCRWTKDGAEGHPRISGFEITNISDDGLQELKKVLATVTLPE